MARFAALTVITLFAALQASAQPVAVPFQSLFEGSALTGVRALAASAEHTSTYYWMAVSQKAQGDNGEALKACQSYQKRDPRGPYFKECNNLF